MNSDIVQRYSINFSLVKVIASNSWDTKLSEFSGTFEKRRKEFQFALSIHTARTVDATNQTINQVADDSKEILAKIDDMKSFFAQILKSEQANMLKRIEEMGGSQKVMQNKKLIKELSPDLDSKGSAAAGNKPGNSSTSEIDEVQEDLKTDPETLIAKNLEVFHRKFEVQARQIIDEVDRIVQRQGDRIINAITAGPHDRIKDPASNFC